MTKECSGLSSYPVESNKNLYQGGAQWIHNKYQNQVTKNNDLLLHQVMGAPIC